MAFEMSASTIASALDTFRTTSPSRIEIRSFKASCNSAPILFRPFGLLVGFQVCPFWRRLGGGGRHIRRYSQGTPGDRGLRLSFVVFSFSTLSTVRAAR